MSREITKEERDDVTQEIDDLRKQVEGINIQLAEIRASLESALKALSDTKCNSEKITELEKTDSRQQGQLNIVCTILGVLSPFLIGGCLFVGQGIIELKIRNDLLREQIVRLENEIDEIKDFRSE